MEGRGEQSHNLSSLNGEADAIFDALTEREAMAFWAEGQKPFGRVDNVRPVDVRNSILAAINSKQDGAASLENVAWQAFGISEPDPTKDYRVGWIQDYLTMLCRQGVLIRKDKDSYAAGQPVPAETEAGEVSTISNDQLGLLREKFNKNRNLR